MLRSELLEHFKKFDTPTICNALELIDSRFRLHGFTTEQMVCADPSLPPIVGYARTATLRALSPVDPKKKREIGLAYYEYVASGEGPNISVIQDLDSSPGLGANWGEVNTNIHKALGILGVKTAKSSGGQRRPFNPVRPRLIETLVQIVAIDDVQAFKRVAVQHGVAIPDSLAAPAPVFGPLPKHPDAPS